MKFISADNIKNNITIKALIEEIESIYKNEAKVPIRQVHNIETLKFIRPSTINVNAGFFYRR